MDDDLRKLLEQVRDRLAADEAPGSSVAELCAAYQQGPEYLALRSRATEAGRIRHLVRLLGDRRADRLTLLDLDGYRRARSAESGPRKQTTRPATRNREVVRLCRVLNWAAERKLIAKSPIDTAPLEPEENTRRTSLERAHVEAMRAACDEYKPRTPRIGLVLRAMVSTAFDSGLRRSELCSLRRAQLHDRDGLIELHERDTKARRGRVTVLSAAAAEDIRAIPRDLRFAASPFVFLTSRGRPYHPRVYLRMFQELAKLAGVEAAAGERVWAHDARAGFVGQCLDAGIPERDIMDMTGHSTREVFDRYHRRRGQAAVSRARDKLEARRGPQSVPDDAAYTNRQEPRRIP